MKTRKNITIDEELTLKMSNMDINASALIEDLLNEHFYKIENKSEILSREKMKDKFGEAENKIIELNVLRDNYTKLFNKATVEFIIVQKVK